MLIQIRTVSIYYTNNLIIHNKILHVLYVCKGILINGFWDAIVTIYAKGSTDQL